MDFQPMSKAEAEHLLETAPGFGDGDSYARIIEAYMVVNDRSVEDIVTVLTAFDQERKGLASG